MAQDFLAAFKTGDYAQAYDELVAAVKAKPGCADTRAQLATLLCFQSEFERAEKQLQSILSLDAGYTPTINTWRQLLAAAQQRHLTFTEGSVPELVAAATPAVERALKLLLAQRSGSAEDAQALSVAMADHSDALPRLTLVEPSGTDDAADSEAQSASCDWQDLDDRFWNIIEVMGSNGKYYWFDIAQIESLKIESPSTLLEHLWLPAKIELVSGETGHVSLPTIYPLAPNVQVDDLGYTYGQKTDWVAITCTGPAQAKFSELELTMGLGRREWLIGEDSRSVLTLAGRTLKPITQGA